MDGVHDRRGGGRRAYRTRGRGSRPARHPVAREVGDPRRECREGGWGCGVRGMVEDLPMNERGSRNRKPRRQRHWPPCPGQPLYSAIGIHAGKTDERDTGKRSTSPDGRPKPLTRTEKLLVTIFVTMFATLVCGGSARIHHAERPARGHAGADQRPAPRTCSGRPAPTLLDMQKSDRAPSRRTSAASSLDMQRQVGELSERMTRMETLVETHLDPRFGRPGSGRSLTHGRRPVAERLGTPASAGTRGARHRARRNAVNPYGVPLEPADAATDTRAL